MSVMGGLAQMLRGLIVEPEGVIVGPEPPAAPPGGGGPEFQFNDPVNSQNAGIMG